MLLAEELFQIDSEAVLEILEQLEPGDAGADPRWRLTLRGIETLLADLDLDLAAKASVLKKVRTQFAKEFEIDSRFKAQLSERFRKERKGLEALLAPAPEATDALAPGCEIFRRRSAQLIPIGTKLRDVEQGGDLAKPIRDLAPSFIHMHANRLLRSAQRAHELLLYDFLARLYDSQLARL
jgi:thiopeptide-type bacteriocin biosynthesis protein